MARRALAYVSDVIIGTTGDVISRETQRQAICRYAAENGIEIAAWFEDEAYSTDLMAREGIRRLLDCGERCDCLLVERVWCLSRNWGVLESFMRGLGQEGLKLESATLLWDCTSQRARHFYAAARTQKARPPETVAAAVFVRIRKPKQLVFANVAHRPGRP